MKTLSKYTIPVLVDFYSDEISRNIRNQALKNLEKWGLQSYSNLILAVAEEAGELAQAYLQYEHEDKEKERIYKETVDLGALCFQILIKGYIDKNKEKKNDSKKRKNTRSR